MSQTGPRPAATPPPPPPPPGDPAPDPRADSLSWPGRLERFAPVAEGGPGRARSLVILTVLSLLLIGVAVAVETGRHPFGRLGYNAETMIVILGGGTGVIALLAMLLYLAMRLGMRSLDVLFVLTPEGAEVRPGDGQQTIDAVIEAAAGAFARSQRLGGGQMLPATALAWNEVSRVTILPERREILLRARRGSLRFHCPDETIFARARAIVESHRAEMGQVDMFGNLRSRPRGA